MTDVVDFEKTAFSTPFRGVLAPSGLQIIAESGIPARRDFLAPGKGGSPLSTPSRPTPHDVGASRVRSCADPPPLATACHRPPE